MANATYVVDAAGTLFGTANDDTITIDRNVADANTYNVEAGGGTDTVIFDAVLGTDGDGVESFFASGNNQFTLDEAGGADREVINLNAVESIQFLNGTITSNASVTPETLMSGPINQDITALAGTVTFDTANLLTWDGSNVSTSAGWTIESVNGQSSSANALITVLDGTTVQGRVAVNGTNNGISVQAENSFHTALDIGEQGTIEVDLVLTNGTDTFSQTVTVDVVGVASNADNTYTGTSAADTIDLLGGDDFGVAGDGSDSVVGGAGNDSVYAGAGDTGNDQLIGNAGDDILAGGAGNDVLIGDSIDSDGALVTDSGTAATDTGTNQLFGGAGDDILVLGGFNDAAQALDATANSGDLVGAAGGEGFGGSGNDLIFGTATGADLIGMGSGNDTVITGDGNTTIYAGVEDEGTDLVTAGDGNNEIYTGAGDDTVTAGNGDNTVGLGAGDDTATTFGTGDNVVYGGAGADTVTGGTGDDTIYGGADADTLNTGNGNNEAFGGVGADTITGGTGDDVIDGGADGDTITVAAGGDNTVTGGTGNDTMTAGAGTDTFVFVDGDGDDVVNAFNASGDLIDLSAIAGVDSASDLIIQDDGADLIIYYGDDNSITLAGLTGTTLTDADFVF